MIVKPFALVAGDYLELEDHRFVGPLVAMPTVNGFGTIRFPGYWGLNGTPYGGVPRIRNILKGPASISAYIDRMDSLEAARASFMVPEVLRAKAELRRIAEREPALTRVPTEEAESPSSIGDLADSCIQSVMAKIVTETLLPEIRKIIAEELEAIMSDTRRFVVTVENYRANRG